MKAVVARSFGPPETLTIEQWDSPALEPGQVRVRIHAAGVGFVDPLMVAGEYQLKPQLPFVPGLEFSGEVIEAAGETGKFPPGTAVCGGTFGGAFADEIAIAEDRLMALPTGTSFAQAAVLRSSYLTAWLALVERAAIKPGEKLLVLGAAGGVGIACCQLGRHLGATVIASASTPEKRRFALDNGADHAVDSRDGDWREQVRAIAGDHGIDVIADTVGGKLAENALRTLGWGGRLLVIGFASGDIPSFPANLALLKGAAILGVDARQFGNYHPAEALAVRERVSALFGAGILAPPIAQVLPMDRVAEAMRMASAGQCLGRVVLRMD